MKRFLGLVLLLLLPLIAGAQITSPGRRVLGDTRGGMQRAVSSNPTVYVATTGNDANNGSIGSPFLTIGKGLTAVGNAGTVYLRGGTYALSSVLTLNQTATATHPINLWAYSSEVPIIECSGITPTWDDGIDILGSYYYLKGLVIQNCHYGGLLINGSNNTIERCDAHNNGFTGMRVLAASTWSARRPANNLFLNCDSHDNYDAPDGGNSDGFDVAAVASTDTMGAGNTLRACRAWNNSDDGFDFWLSTQPVTVDSCWSWKNGWKQGNTDSVKGNGNGVKLGYTGVNTSHIFTRCLSFDNRMNGWITNGNAAAQTFYNCDGFRNAENFRLNTGVSSILTNCISYLGPGNDELGTTPVSTTNSWTSWSTYNAGLFKSVDTTGVTGARDANGNLPVLNFLRLSAGNTMINGGTNVGYGLNVGALDSVAGTAPSVVTSPATAVAPTSATLNGTVDANSVSTATSFDYGTTTAVSSNIVATPTPVTGTLITSISAGLTGLSATTKYYFKAKGIGSSTVQGALDSLTTNILYTTLYDSALVSAKEGVSQHSTLGCFENQARWGEDASKIYQAGFRLCLNIPNAATIDSCFLSVGCNSGSQGWDVATDTAIVEMLDADSVVAYGDGAHNMEGHAAGLVSGSVTWTAITYTTNAISRSPNLATLLQSVVNRAGWKANNYAGFVVKAKTAVVNHLFMCKSASSSGYNNVKVVYH